MTTSTFSLLALLALAVAPATGGCVANEPEVNAADENVDTSADALRVRGRAALKRQVLRISRANTQRTDNLEQVREELNPLVARLARIYGCPAAEAELEATAGGWRQVWSDDFRPEPAGSPFTGDLAQIYQVVTANGYFYNLGERKGPGGALVTGVLRGQYESAQPRGLDIQFTKFGVLRTGIPSSPLETLAADLESGVLPIGTIPTGPPGGAGGPPAGPVGIKGKLQTLFVDATVRIVLGGTADQSFNRLYVLERADVRLD